MHRSLARRVDGTAHGNRPVPRSRLGVRSGVKDLEAQTPVEGQAVGIAGEDPEYGLGRLPATGPVLDLADEAFADAESPRSGSTHMLKTSSVPGGRRRP